ncbi:MAG: HDOD domain-containing protein [Acidobacteriota bacterium]|nr:HDOD domain-containing protein [Acidobacteriota bacterium]
MTTQTAESALRVENESLTGSGTASEARYVARQPIFDLRGRVHGYELLFRSGPVGGFSGDLDSATRQMLDNTVLFGLEKLSGNVLSFVNCTREALVGEFVKVLSPNQVVLEILENIEPDEELIHALKKQKAHGFRLALDDFLWKPELQPFVELADYIKVDLLQSGPLERRELFRRLAGRPVALLAEKVESMEDYHLTCSEGFRFFQGYYFCRPTLLENHKVPENRISQLELLATLQQSGFDVHRITRMVKRDAGITYRLLRLINSPMYGLQKEIGSVETALITVGESTFRRIVMLAVASELNAGGTGEILKMALVRARFCERAAGDFGLDANEQYLVGMFSVLPTMLRVPMESAIESLPLGNEIRSALMGDQCAERCALDWVEGVEQGDWRRCDAITRESNVAGSKLLEAYEAATQWAAALLSSAGV